MAAKQTGLKGSVLITGAAGGIGVATVRRLDELGYQVFAGVQRAADGEALQRSISARVCPVLLNITDPSSVAAAAETITASVGNASLVGLINNAGLIVEGPVELVPLAEVREQFDVNVIGHIAVTQAGLPLLRAGRGRVINIGAASGQITFPYLGVLSASKAALEAITDALRIKLRPWHIAVSIIDPMGMQTKIFEKSAAAARQSRQSFSQEQQHYATGLAAVYKALANQHFDPPQVVVAAIEHALTAPNPRARYLVGRGANMIPFLRILPDRLRDTMLMRTLGLA